mgnify:CR=1 FL=1
MALFVTKEGKRKSPMAVTCFFVDLLFCLVFGGMYALLTGVLHDHLPLGGGMAENWIHLDACRLRDSGHRQGRRREHGHQGTRHYALQPGSGGLSVDRHHQDQRI